MRCQECAEPIGEEDVQECETCDRLFGSCCIEDHDHPEPQPEEVTFDSWRSPSSEPTHAADPFDW